MGSSSSIGCAGIDDWFIQVFAQNAQDAIHTRSCHQYERKLRNPDPTDTLLHLNTDPWVKSHQAGDLPCASLVASPFRSYGGALRCDASGSRFRANLDTPVVASPAGPTPSRRLQLRDSCVHHKMGQHGGNTGHRGQIRTPDPIWSSHRRPVLCGQRTG